VKSIENRLTERMNDLSEQVMKLPDVMVDRIMKYLPQAERVRNRQHILTGPWLSSWGPLFLCPNSAAAVRRSSCQPRICMNANDVLVQIYRFPLRLGFHEAIERRACSKKKGHRRPFAAWVPPSGFQRRPRFCDEDRRAPRGINYPNWVRAEEALKRKRKEHFAVDWSLYVPPKPAATVTSGPEVAKNCPPKSTPTCGRVDLSAEVTDLITRSLSGHQSGSHHHRFLPGPSLDRNTAAT
jgi:hypothetical protein